MFKFCSQKNLNILKTYKLNIFQHTPKNILKPFTQVQESPGQIEKNLMKKLYNKKIDDSLINDFLNSLLRQNTAVIAYKGEIKMDYFAKTLSDYNIPITVINLDLNPVLHEAFIHFYPFISKSKYLLFLKGKLVDTDDFTGHLNDGTVEKFLKSYNLI